MHGNFKLLKFPEKCAQRSTPGIWGYFWGIYPLEQPETRGFSVGKIVSFLCQICTKFTQNVQKLCTNCARNLSRFSVSFSVTKSMCTKVNLKCMSLPFCVQKCDNFAQNVTKFGQNCAKNGRNLAKIHEIWPPWTTGFWSGECVFFNRFTLVGVDFTTFSEICENREIFVQIWSPSGSGDMTHTNQIPNCWTCFWAKYPKKFWPSGQVSPL